MIHTKSTTTFRFQPPLRSVPFPFRYVSRFLRPYPVTPRSTFHEPAD